MGPSGDEKSLMKFSHFDRIHWRDRQTEWYTDTAQHQRPCYA